MNGQIMFFLIVKLSFPELILVEVAYVCGAHFFKELGANFLLHALIH